MKNARDNGALVSWPRLIPYNEQFIKIQNVKYNFDADVAIFNCKLFE